MIRTLALASASMIAVALSAFASPAFAQATLQLRDVDIDAAPGLPSAEGPTLSSSTLDKAFRRRQAATSDVAEILRTTPGIGAEGGGGFSSLPSIRGLGGDHVAVTIDGAPVDMACPNFMNPPLSYVDPQTLDAILVMKGVSPVSFGGDNIGGIIAATTAPPRFAEPGKTLSQGEASLFYRSNDQAVGGGLSATIANDLWSASYVASLAKAENYRGGAGDGRVRSTEYAKTGHALTLGRRTAIGLFVVKASLDYVPYEGFPNQWMDMTLNRSWAVNGRYEGAFSWGSASVAVYHRDVRHKMNFLDDKGGDADGGMPMDTWVKSSGFTSKADVALAPRQTLRLGGEFHHQGLEDVWPAVAGSMMMGPDPYINVHDGRRDRLGLFVELESRWSDAFSSVVGLRHDAVSMNAGAVQPYSTGMMSAKDAMAAKAFNAADHKHDDSNWGASALLRYAPRQGLVMELGYARKSQSPNLYELYAWGRGAMSSQMIGWYGDGNGYVGNLALRPEKADTLSAAVEISGAGQAGWRLKVEPYLTRVEDFIDARKIADLTNRTGQPSGFVQLQFANVDARLYGVDVSGDARLLTSPTLGEVRAKASLSVLRGQNRVTRGDLYRQTPSTGRLSLEQKIGGWTNALELELVADKDRVDTVRRERRTSGYQLVNLRTAYQWRSVTVSLGVENLANRSYALPLGGVSLGDFDATGLLRQAPGRGRSIDLGLTARF